MMQELDDCSTGGLCICKPTTRKAASCSSITREVQAYHQQRANLPAVVQMTKKIEAIVYLHMRETR